MESKTGHNIMVTCNKEGTSGEHNTRCQESNGIRRNISRIKESPDKSKNERFGTWLEAIVEEHTGELVQSEHRELISSDCKEESNYYESTTSAASLASHTDSEEASYLSEEMFSFYKVQPRWVMTDHRNTVWDCCTALLHNSEHIISESERSASCDDRRQILISCSGDRTLR